MYVAALLILSALIRLIWVIAVPTRPVMDFAMYYESATHLMVFGQLDDGFAYMPGYVFLLALVQELGGNVLAARIVTGVLFAPLLGFGIFLIARRCFGPAVALVALALYTSWPAGVATSGLLGTDLPAAALVALAFGLLATWYDRRPWRAVVAFGLVLGLSAWIRAVALPLSLLCALYAWSRGTQLRPLLARSCVAVAVTVLVLLPWGMRNVQRHGEFFLTDSHGGLTALLGANPNSDGAFTYDLYRMFEMVYGEPVLTGDHRRADRAAYRMALDWAWFEPRFALGLAVAKAERLFAREQVLLYWPIYRPGALPASTQAWFVAHRRALHAVTDGFGLLLIVTFVAGVALLVLRRRWGPLALLLPAQLLLTALYIAYFGEARYRLALQALAFPLAAFGLVSLRAAVVVRPLERRAFATAGALLMIGTLAVPALGRTLRDRYRWVARLCHDGAAPRICKDRHPGGAPSLAGASTHDR